MAAKPTYEELEQRVKEFEEEVVLLRQAEEVFLLSQDQLEAVKQIGELANSSLNLDEVLKNIIDGTMKAAGASAGMLFIKNKESEYLSWAHPQACQKPFLKTTVTNISF